MILRTTLLLAFAATQTALFAAADVDPDQFFRPGPSAPADKPADQAYPKGTMFPFSFFSVGGGSKVKANDLLPEEEVQKEFARYKATGLPMFGPQYELNERSLKDAEKLGLKVMYTVGIPMNFHAKKGEPALVRTPEEVYEEISRQVKAVVDNKDIVIWYLKPEELRPWKKNEMAYLEAASKAVRDSDPQKRPFWVYDPNHAGAKRLAAIAPWEDYVGKGMYANYAKHKESRVFCRWTIEQEIEAIRASGSSAVPVALPEMFQDPSPEETALIPQWVRHDVFLALATGAKGVFVFSARIRPNFEQRDAYYSAYEAVARQLFGKGLDQVFLFGERREDIHLDVTEGPEEVEFIFPAGDVPEDKPIMYPSVSLANIAFGDARYLILVNSAKEPVSVMLGGMPYGETQAQNLLEEGSPFEVVEGEFPVKLDPLGVRVFRVSRK